MTLWTRFVHWLWLREVRTIETSCAACGARSTYRMYPGDRRIDLLHVERPEP